MNRQFASGRSPGKINVNNESDGCFMRREEGKVSKCLGMGDEESVMI